jgi:hypothetical protein
MPVGSASDSAFIEGRSLFLPRWASLKHNDWFKVSKSILGFRDPLLDSQEELPSQTTTVHNCPLKPQQPTTPLSNHNSPQLPSQTTTVHNCPLKQQQSTTARFYRPQLRRTKSPVEKFITICSLSDYVNKYTLNGGSVYRLVGIYSTQLP